MRLTSSEIAGIVNGRLIGLPDLIVNEIVTDSRQVSFAENVAFVALKGKNHDGNKYIIALYHQGMRFSSLVILLKILSLQRSSVYSK
jgi:UDP-N-acetylmuramyl pentapeptide synthase